MIHDYYIWLSSTQIEEKQIIKPEYLVQWSSDRYTVASFNGDRQDARKKYINATDGFSSFHQFCVINPDFVSLPSPNWLGLQVDFELLTPWYSKDDRIFHVLDNPVRKDRMFGVPFMNAASWKGMLRWACRMQACLKEHLEQRKRFDEWKDPDWILHLFGNEKGEERDLNQGALVFYPTWFNKIGFEVINPHSRKSRAGTQLIYYEVVPPKATGTLYLLYAPWPGMKPAVDHLKFMPKFLQAIETLLTNYGISAKRTVGWGTARITKWKVYHNGQKEEKNDWKSIYHSIQSWFQTGGTR